MASEAAIICIDNSESMRNGDYSPTRFLAQIDAAQLMCTSKIESNPKNTLGVLVMAGNVVELLVSPTGDSRMIWACLDGLEVGGEMDLGLGIQVAQSTLMHLKHEMQQQRIIVFAGSAVNCDKEELEIIGRGLKNDGVGLDVVDFGEDDEVKSEKLEALVAAVNNNDNSYIARVPAGPNVLSNALSSTPIFTRDWEVGRLLGVDRNLDPELATAFDASMEEEKARQEAAAKKAAEEAAAKKAEEEA